jgi:hypothetical protein
MEHVVGLMVDLGQNPVYVPLLTIELKTLAPFWTIFNYHFVFDAVVIISLTIMLLVKDQYCFSLQYLLIFFASFVKSFSPHHH